MGSWFRKQSRWVRAGGVGVKGIVVHIPEFTHVGGIEDGISWICKGNWSFEGALKGTIEKFGWWEVSWACRVDGMDDKQWLKVDCYESSRFLIEASSGKLSFLTNQIMD